MLAGKIALLVCIFFSCSNSLGQDIYRRNPTTGTIYEYSDGIGTTRYSDGSYRQSIKNGYSYFIKEYDAKTGKTRYGTRSFGVTRYSTNQNTSEITRFNDGSYEKADPVGQSSYRITERSRTGKMKYGIHTSSKPTPYVSGQKGKGQSGSISPYSANYGRPMVFESGRGR